MTNRYHVGQEAIDWFLDQKTIANEDDLRRFLERCRATPGEWQILSAHASLNAARTKVAKMRQGYMANTIRAAWQADQVELGVTNNGTLGPCVIVRCKA